MASLFAAAWSDASADIDAEFGENLVLYPREASGDPTGRRDPNARFAASSSRSPTPFVGIFFDKGSMLHAHGRSMADSTTRPVVAERPMIDVDRAQFFQDPAQGDVIQRISLLPGFEPVMTYEITRFVVDDLNRAWIHLAELRAQSSLTR